MKSEFKVTMTIMALACVCEALRCKHYSFIKRIEVLWVLLIMSIRYDDISQWNEILRCFLSNVLHVCNNTLYISNYRSLKFKEAWSDQSFLRFWYEKDTKCSYNPWEILQLKYVPFRRYWWKSGENLVTMI